MDRKEAVALIKEIVDSNLVEPSFIVLKDNGHAMFDLETKGACGGCRKTELTVFLASKDLLLSENKKKGMCRIYKP